MSLVALDLCSNSWEREACTLLWPCSENKAARANVLDAVDYTTVLVSTIHL